MMKGYIRWPIDNRSKFLFMYEDRCWEVGYTVLEASSFTGNERSIVSLASIEHYNKETLDRS